MSLRIPSNRDSKITFSGNYSCTVTVKTADKTISRPATIAARNSPQHFAPPRCLEVTVLKPALMQVQSRTIQSEKRARNRLFAVSVEQ